MKAIQTKYLPATNTKPSRIKAWMEGGHSVTITYHGDGEANDHEKAARMLCAKMGWNNDLRGGGLPDESQCWVIVPKAETMERTRLIRSVQRMIPWMARLIHEGVHKTCAGPMDAEHALAEAEDLIALIKANAQS